MKNVGELRSIVKEFQEDVLRIASEEMNAEN